MRISQSPNAALCTVKCFNGLSVVSEAVSAAAMVDRLSVVSEAFNGEKWLRMMIMMMLLLMLMLKPSLKAKQSKAKQSKAKLSKSKAKQSKAKQSKAKQIQAEQKFQICPMMPAPRSKICTS